MADSWSGSAYVLAHLEDLNRFSASPRAREIAEELGNRLAQAEHFMAREGILGRFPAEDDPCWERWDRARRSQPEPMPGQRTGDEAV